MLYWPELDDVTNLRRQNCENGNIFDEGHFYHNVEALWVRKKRKSIFFEQLEVSTSRWIGFTQVRMGWKVKGHSGEKSREDG